GRRELPPQRGGRVGGAYRPPRATGARRREAGAVVQGGEAVEARQPHPASTSDAEGRDVMRAVVQRRYGPPEEVLRVEDVPRPEPQAGEVLVRVIASSVTRSDLGYSLPHPWFVRAF